MPKIAPANKRAPRTPPGVVVTMGSPPPVGDPDLGIKLPPSGRRPGKHPLVTIGDSQTQGYQSGAIFNTDLSWPALVAKSGGYYASFRRPHYDKFGGLPLNLEYLQRCLEERYGPAVTGLKFVEAIFFLRGKLVDICHYWQDGDGAFVPRNAWINDNLATFGYDLRDALSLAPANILATIAGTHENMLLPLVTHGKERAALRTLPYFDPQDPAAHPSLTALEAAEVLSRDGAIDTLVVELGANNVLRVTVDLSLKWSKNGYNRLGKKDAFNIWQPQHFAAEFAEVARRIERIDARRVIFTTIPHITVVPVLHGIGQKVAYPDGTKSRYFRYYSRPWFDTHNFNPRVDPRLTENDARTVDSVIDQYNETIVDTVRTARDAGRDWYIFDLRTLLDRLAYRRYMEAPSSPPPWWTPYVLPPELAALTPVPDTRFYLSDPTGRLQGGIVSLDGIHPTTIGYGLMAHEVIKVMTFAGVKDLAPVDFSWLINQDTLVSHPPRGFDATLGVVRWMDENYEFLRHLFAPRRKN